MGYDTVKLGKICRLINGSAIKSGEFREKGVPVIKIANVKANRILLDKLQCVSEEVAEKYQKSRISYGDILLTMTGNRMDGGPDSWVGKSAMFREQGEYLLNQRLCIVRPISSEIDSEYLSYVLSSWDAQMYFITRATSSGGQANISPTIINGYDVPLPDIITQRKIAKVLSLIDLKIRNNEKMNIVLEAQALAIYKEMFGKTSSINRSTCRADEFFDISIGKTPPRKEKEWFTGSGNAVTWVSIADMGSGGVFATTSSECLTEEAVKKFNVVVVPDHTVILSFKLTVGRVAITVGDTTTNEAIAHFKTNREDLAEYTYCYLKSFDFTAIGNTSSIGTAVNSKIIKSMPFVIPEEQELAKFNSCVLPMFQRIKVNQIASIRLASLRDGLIPELLSGSLSPDRIEIE